MLANVTAFTETWRAKLRELFYQHAKLCATHPLVVLSLAFTCINTCSAPAIWAIFYSPTSLYRFWEFSEANAPINTGLDSPEPGNRVRVEQIFIDTSLAPGLIRDEFLDPGSLNLPSLKLASKIQQELNDLTILASSNKVYSLRDICLESLYKGNCIIYSPLEFWDNTISNLKSNNFASLSETVSKWEVNGSFGLPVPSWTVFNGLRLDPKAKTLIGAESLLITYFLRTPSTLDTPDLWEHLWSQTSEKIDTFCQDIGDIQLNSIVAGTGETKTNHFKFSSRSRRISTEFFILSLGYLTVILYLFFFLGRFQLVKSKFWLGFAAVFLLNVSLLMSFGLCLFFGNELNFLPWEVVPILIIAVGAENMLRITNSVVSTSLDLPVKERIGVGVRNCSVGVTAHLFGELTILGVASLSSNAAIREFGLFGSIAVIIDYLLQLTFYIAVLSIDIRRLELSDLQDRKLWPISDSNNTEIPALESDESLMLATIWESMLERLEKVKSYSFFKFGMLGLSLIAVGIISEKLRRSSFFSQQEDLHLSESILPSRYQLDAKFWEVINPSQSDLYIEFRPPTRIYLTWTPSDQELAKFSSLKTQDISIKKSKLHKPSLRFMIMLLVTGGVITMYLRFLAHGRRQEKAQWESLDPRKTIRIFRGLWADVVLLASNSKELVAALSLSGELIVWSYFIDRIVFRTNLGSDYKITAIAISTNSWLAYGSATGKVHLIYLASNLKKTNSFKIDHGNAEREIIQLSFLPSTPDFLLLRTKGGHLVIYSTSRSQVVYTLDEKLKASYFHPTSSKILIGLEHGDLIFLNLCESSPTESPLNILSSFGTSTINYIASLDLEGRMRAIIVGYNNYDAELFLLCENTKLCQLAFPSCDNRPLDSLLEVSLSLATDGIYVIRTHVGYTSISHVTYRDSTQITPPISPVFKFKLTSNISFTNIDCPYSIILPGSLMIGLSRQSLEWDLWGLNLSLASLTTVIKNKLKYKLISDPILVNEASSSSSKLEKSSLNFPISDITELHSSTTDSRSGHNTPTHPWVPFGSIVVPICRINENSGVVIAMSNYIICLDPQTLFSIPPRM